jgi:hypothetical protein
MEQLNEEQVEAFDKEYVNNNRWVPIKRCIDRDFPDGQFSFLDLGGGNGIFADRMLASYPKSAGVVLDNSPLLLDRNRPSARKRVVLGSVENLACIDLTKYDLVFFNWVLHHLVSRSFARSRENIDCALRSVMALLTERGRVSISENMYNGLVIDGLPGWIVYQLTSAKTISWLTKKGGANTAGVGVCFRSYSEWCSTIQRIGFRILDFTNDDAWKIPWTWHAFFHVGHIRCGHFWLSLH